MKMKYEYEIRNKKIDKEIWYFEKVEYEQRDLFGVVESLDAVEAKPDWEQLAHL